MAKIRSGASTDELTIDATSKAARNTLYKADGTPVSVTDMGNGVTCLNTVTMQNVIVSTLNSSQDPIINGGLFQGLSESTLGVNLIQVNIFSNTVLALYIDQSMDGFNWDMISLPMYTSTNAGTARNYLATAAYYRIRVLNNSGITASIVRIQTCLCPNGSGAQDLIKQSLTLVWEEMTGTANVESTLTNFTTGTLAGASLSAATHYVITSGRSLMITAIGVYIRGTNNTYATGRYRIRTSPIGTAITNTSPIVFSIQLNNLGASGGGNTLWTPIADGIKVLAGQAVTFTWNTTIVNNVVGMTIVGYEF
jgi:hypothetical protein